MINRAVLVAVSAALAAGFLASDVQAGARFGVRFWHGQRSYYPGPEYIPPPRYYRYFIAPEDLQQDDQFDQAYGENFDDSYYDPSYDPPVPKTAPVRKKAAAAPVEPKPAQHKQTSVKTATQSSGDTAAPKPAATLSCDKAAGIVSGYGFGSVKASDCEGQVYAFNASRSGKSYAIKLNAVSGELTEVKKLE